MAWIISNSHHSSLGLGHLYACGCVGHSASSLKTNAITPQSHCQPGNAPDGPLLSSHHHVKMLPAQHLYMSPLTAPLDSGIGCLTSNISLLFLQKLPSLNAGWHHSAKVLYYRITVDSSVDPLPIKEDGRRSGLTPFKEKKCLSTWIRGTEETPFLPSLKSGSCMPCKPPPGHPSSWALHGSDVARILSGLFHQNIPSSWYSLFFFHSRTPSLLGYVPSHPWCIWNPICIVLYWDLFLLLYLPLYGWALVFFSQLSATYT